MRCQDLQGQLIHSHDFPKMFGYVFQKDLRHAGLPLLLSDTRLSPRAKPPGPRRFHSYFTINATAPQQEGEKLLQPPEKADE